jgi:hypothetical protein
LSLPEDPPSGGTDDARDDPRVEEAAPDAPLTIEHAADETLHPGEEVAPAGQTPPPPVAPVATQSPKKKRLPSFNFRTAGSFIVRNLAWFLLALALITAGVFAALWLDLKTEADERAELEQEAERFAIALTNFSADTIDEDVADIKSFAVGDFAEEAEAFFGQEAVDAIKEAEAESQGEIESVYVQELDGDTASVFAVVNETVTNADLAEPRTDILRMSIDLVRSKSGWKVTNVDVLQSPGSTVLQGA